MSIEDKLKQLEEKKSKTKNLDPQAAEKQHQKGKLTARERIDLLIDPGTFEEFDPFVKTRSTYFGLDKKIIPADGVVTGIGLIDGRRVALYSQDFTSLGGSLGEMHALKIVKMQELAMKLGIPFVAMNDSGGARIQEGVDSLRGYGEIFLRNVRASGVIPQISLQLGPTAGGAVYSPALMDFIIMTEQATMYITGPNVVEAVTGEKVTHEQLGGGVVHNEKSGVAHFLAKNDEDAINIAKTLLSYLPDNYLQDPPKIATPDSPNRETPLLLEIVPDEPNLSFDVKEVINEVVDENTFFEVHEDFARNAVVGFARINGRTVGIVANQPAYLAGVLDINSSDKIARFVRFCDAFNIPLVTFVDTPGYMPGTAQEHGGVIRHGAKILYAYSEATVPKITIVMRKAYGGAYIAMCSRHLGADAVFAFPQAEIAVMGAEGAANIIFAKEIETAENKEEIRKKKIEEYREQFSNPYLAAERGYIDDVINPKDTRKIISYMLDFLRSKHEDSVPKKHGNIPL
ncbi:MULTISPECIES: acyl-CoA carboxylase subunit beta [Caldisericum]|uniref:acyl-CoA carboxylase subunit beta n=1 Tax=Caldisericum TaxID=693074 RepID=UPI003C72CE01